MKLINAVIFAIVCSSSLNVLAGSRKMLVWSDSQGFVEKSCKVKPAADIDFAIADNQSNESNFVKIHSINSSHEFDLPKYSIIRITDNPALEGNILLSVISPSNNPGIETDVNTAFRFWGTSSATRIAAQQALYIDENSVRSANDYVIELLDKNNPKLIIEQNMNAESTLWTTQINSDFFTTAECCVNRKCEDYTVFNVFKKYATEAKFLTQVGVSNLDTEIFSNVMVYPKNPVSNDTEKAEDESPTEDANKDQYPVTNVIDESMPENLLPKQGTLETVVCLENVNHSLSVRDENLENILFNIKNGSTIKIFQGWDQEDENKTKVVNGTTYNYVRVQTDSGIGYAPKELLKDKSECESIELQEPQAASRQNDAGNTPAESDKLKVDNTYFVCTESGESLSVRDLNFKRMDRAYNVDHKEKVTVVGPEVQTHAGIEFIKVKTEAGFTRMIGADYLNSTECANAAAAEYIFPTFTSTGYSYLETAKRPRTIREFSRYRGYTEAWGAYGARRSAGKRAHAATDLYQKRGQPRPSGPQYTVSHFGGAFRAMTSGRIIRGPTAFYLGTYYSVILHDDNTIGIYGETYGNLLTDGGRVNAGEKLGYIKWVGENSVPAMLHMEHYKKSDAIMNEKDGWKGSKVINGRNSKRAEQLFDRTDFMKSLEARNF